MDDKVQRLLRAYMRMTDAQKSEANIELDKIRRGDNSGLRTLSERVEKMDLGPMGGVCPYCGR